MFVTKFSFIKGLRLSKEGKVKNVFDEKRNT